VDNPVLGALADPTRRHLLDLLFERDGRPLAELVAAVPGMTRSGVMKHLRVLESVDLVTTRRVGREKHHYLNPVPIRRLHDRWLDKYRARAADSLLDLQRALEKLEGTRWPRPPRPTSSTPSTSAPCRRQSGARSRNPASPGATSTAARWTPTGSGLGAGSATLEQVSDGWPFILSGLKSLLETGKGLVEG
jgi:DNA-binding transcriptional ArsR family regulator